MRGQSVSEISHEILGNDDYFHSQLSILNPLSRGVSFAAGAVRTAWLPDSNIRDNAKIQSWNKLAIAGKRALTSAGY